MCLPEHHPILHGSSQGGWLEFSEKIWVESNVNDGNHPFTDIHFGSILKMMYSTLLRKKPLKKKGHFCFEVDGSFSLLVGYICSFPGGLSFTLFLRLRVQQMSVSPPRQ